MLRLSTEIFVIHSLYTQGGKHGELSMPTPADTIR